MAEQQDARKILSDLLESYKLGSLTDVIWSKVSNEEITRETPIDEIGFMIKDTEAYKQRFAGNVALAKAGKPERLISEYLRLEEAYKAAIQGSGIPEGFYDSPEDFASFIGQDVSVAEIQDRVNQGFRAVADANPQVVAQMKELYGVDEAGLAAYFLDPAKATPVLTRQARAAQIAAESRRQASIQLGVSEAEALARENVTQQQAQAGFAQIAEQQQLFTPIAGERGEITREEQIAGTFGTSEAARARIASRARQRRAEFEAGGSLAATTQGVAGLRTA